MLNMSTAIRRGIKGAFAEPLVLAAAFGIYVLMLACVWVFVRSREATVVDLVLTLIAPVVVCALFFALQSLAVGPGPNDGSKRHVSSLFRDGWKLFVVSIPVILIAIIVWLLMDRFTPSNGGSFARRTLLPAIGMIILCVFLPLVAIRLWIASRSGIKNTYRGIGRSILNALNPSRVLIYVGFALVFGGIAYLLIFKKTPVDREWLEVGLLGLRLALAGVVIFLGWFLGVRAVAELNRE